MHNTKTLDVEVYLVDDIPVRIQRKKVRNLRLRITERGEFYLSLPWRAPLHAAHEFLEEQREWVTQKAEHHRRRQEKTAQLADGETIAWWGQTLRLQVEEVAGKRAKAEIRGEILFLQVPAGASFEQRQRAVDRLRRQSLETRLEALLPRWAAKFEIDKVGTVRIRRMKTRWGSCNPKTRALTFNLDLSARDPKYLEYVVAHELTHYFHANHGSEFHALLGKHLPEERGLRRELNAR